MSRVPTCLAHCRPKRSDDSYLSNDETLARSRTDPPGSMDCPTHSHSLSSDSKRSRSRRNRRVFVANAATHAPPTLSSLLYNYIWSRVVYRTLTITLQPRWLAELAAPVERSRTFCVCSIAKTKYLWYALRAARVGVSGWGGQGSVQSMSSLRRVPS